MSNVCVGLASTPRFAVLPSSFARSVIVAVPNAFAAGVNVNVPVELTAGPAENRAALVLLVTSKLIVWAASLAGPKLIPVGQPATVWAPASSSAVWLPPLVKLGASLTAVTVMSND